MRTLVTGATGFLGGHVVDALRARGDVVRALVRPRSDTARLRACGDVEFVEGDLGDKAGLAAAAAGVDVVVHAAARVGERGAHADFVADNVIGTEHLLDAARRAGVRRFVFVSSPSVVGIDADQIDVDERAPYPRRFLNAYSETKAIAEQRVLAAHASDFTTCALRPRAVWGPRDRTGFLPTLVDRLRRGRLPDLSGGRVVRASLTFCTNAADAIVAATTAPAVGGRVYFVADDEPVDVWAFLHRLAAHFGAPPITRRVSPDRVRPLVHVVDALWRFPPVARWRAPPLSRYALALLTRTSTFDVTAARRDLDFLSRVDLTTGLQRLTTWIEQSGGVGHFVRDVR
jgi:nucleoside-diphosphate-sugar epimerase